MAATAGSIEQARAARGPQWARKYPPLLTVLAAVVIVLAVLPSALNVPQSNPTQTLEYAPIPPDDQDAPPDNSGNLSSLGLGRSSSLEQQVAPTTIDPNLSKDLPVSGKTSSTKKCVGNPPRQTEDPLSPPCVGNFTGDNGGATYQGVSKDEIRILFYLQGFTNYLGCSGGSEVTPDHEYFDLFQEPDPDKPEHCEVRSLRVWQQYFNERYQTYNRRVHFFVYFSGQDESVAARKSEAADNFSKVKPFAVLSFVTAQADAYLESMAKRGVLNFGSYLGRDASFFARFPKLIWGLYPSIQQQAKQFGSYVCQKVWNQPVSGLSGNATEVGGPRKYGLIYTSDEGHPELRAYKDAVNAEIEKCTGKSADQFYAVPAATFPSSGYFQDNRYPPSYAVDGMQRFQAAGVTTIIWPGGYETQFSKAGARLGYFPEIIASGDRNLEGNGNAQYQDQNFWSHVAMVTNVVYTPESERQQCYLAYREVDQTAPRSDITFTACDKYPDIRQLFIGIQVAGPKLGPSSIDKGFHAIPRIPSNDNMTPACFYDPGDYTCTKDATVEWYDPTTQHANNRNPGAYRMMENGRRYLANTWAAGNIDAQKQASDLVNGYNGDTILNPNPPDTGI